MHNINKIISASLSFLKKIWERKRENQYVPKEGIIKNEGWDRSLMQHFIFLSSRVNATIAAVSLPPTGLKQFLTWSI